VCSDCKATRKRLLIVLQQANSFTESLYTRSDFELLTFGTLKYLYWFINIGLIHSFLKAVSGTMIVGYVFRFTKKKCNKLWKIRKRRKNSRSFTKFWNVWNHCLSYRKSDCTDGESSSSSIWKENRSFGTCCWANLAYFYPNTVLTLPTSKNGKKGFCRVTESYTFRIEPQAVSFFLCRLIFPCRDG
jgi:hypothetical protein